MSSDIKKKAKRVLTVAQDFYSRNPDWVSFFRVVVGVEGAVHSAFPESKSLAAFKRTSEYAEIEQMLTRLREQEDILQVKETVRVITVRLPQSLHDALTAEAKNHATSVNKLCISKLIRIIDGELIPNGKPRGKDE